MKAQAIIPAAGNGHRLKSSVLKPFIEVNGLPLIVHTIQHFEACALIDGVILVVPQERMAEFEGLVQKHGLAKVTRIVVGGATRRESVYNGLQVIDHDTQIIVVHDGARPLADAALIEKAVQEAAGFDAVVTGVPVSPTIKRVDPESMTITETIARSNLWEIQTPQVFKRDVLIKAHQQNGTKEATDDAMLVEQLGIKVRIIEGSVHNIKVTTLEDLATVEALLAKRKSGVT